MTIAIAAAAAAVTFGSTAVHNAHYTYTVVYHVCKLHRCATVALAGSDSL
jgi:hypothetical protein